jgi:uncharacterized NAD(P)/FAD-binding protein YdhS
VDTNDGARQTGSHTTIAIIGGGFSGAMLATHLLRMALGASSVVLIDPRARPGRGVAYGTEFDGHLLNVRARDMSAYPDLPDHFVKWAKRNYSSSVKPSDFLPRTTYGDYVESQFREAANLHPTRIRFIQQEAVSLERVGHTTRVHLSAAQTVAADKVVLALGNFPPNDLPLPGQPSYSDRYIANPWAADAFRPTSQDHVVLLIGTALTSVDKVIELRTRGFEGIIHILSRRGLLPQSHKTIASFPAFWNNESPRTVRGLLQLIRFQVKTAEGQGLDWRSVIDSLRPTTQEIWRTLPRTEQRRFLRHLRPYWEVHRHRIAGRVADQLAQQIRRGKIRVHAGRIAEYAEDPNGVAITYRDRKSGMPTTLRVDRVINCTGPEADYRRVESPLLADLFAKKLVRPDALSLGLDISDGGALIDANGAPSDFLYALGPLRKGGLWESVAVPEIRIQATELAKRLIGGSTATPGRIAGSALRAEVAAQKLRVHGYEEGVCHGVQQL